MRKLAVYFAYFIAFLLVTACLISVASAQSYTTVSATTVQDGFGALMASGVACFYPTASDGTFVNITPSGGSAVPGPFCTVVTTGAFSLGTTPNLATAAPSGLLYTLIITKSTGVTTLTLSGLAITGSTYNLDSLVVPTPPYPGQPSAYGLGIPYYPCLFGALYTRTDASTPATSGWTCQVGGSGTFWAQTGKGVPPPAPVTYTTATQVTLMIRTQGGGGSGTVTLVSSADTNATVATGSTTPIITINAAPKLAIARNINGVPFDGTAPITITAVPSGTCGGALAGTYPNCTIAGLGSTASVFTYTDGAGNLRTSVNSYVDSGGFLNQNYPGINIVTNSGGSGGQLPGIYFSNLFCASGPAEIAAALDLDTGNNENDLIVGKQNACFGSGLASAADIGFITQTGGTHKAPGTSIFSVTNSQLTSNVVTLTAANTLSVGQFVLVFNLTSATFLNNGTYTVLSASGTQFTFAFTHANVGSAAESGNAEQQVDNQLDIANQTNGIINIGGTVGTPLMSFRAGTLVPAGIYFPTLGAGITYLTASGGPLSSGNLSGDLTTSGLVTTFATVNSGPGLCGDATHVCQITTDGKGRVTLQAAVAITGGGSPLFSGIGTATNTSATMTCGTGCSMLTSGSGSIIATNAISLSSGGLGQVPYQISTGNTNFTSAPTVNGLYALTEQPVASVAVVPVFTLLAASATTDTTNATNISSGTLGAARLPAALSSSTSINGTSVPLSVTLGLHIANGTSALGTGAISSATCATVVTTTATGTATTDVVGWGFNSDPTAVTGYAPLTAGMLTIIAYPSSGNVNFKVCNNTSASITPGAVTLNWTVIR